MNFNTNRKEHTMNLLDFPAYTTGQQETFLAVGTPVRIPGSQKKWTVRKVLTGMRAYEVSTGTAFEYQTKRVAKSLVKTWSAA